MKAIMVDCKKINLAVKTRISSIQVGERIFSLLEAKKTKASVDYKVTDPEEEA